MTIKDYIKRENLVPDEYIDEFFDTYGHITKISTLRLLATDFLRNKKKEKAFNIHKFAKKFYVKYDTFEGPISKTVLKENFKEINLKDEPSFEDAESALFNVHNKDISKRLIDYLFNSFNFARFFKGDDYYNSVLSQMTTLGLIDKNKFFKTINEELKDKEEFYKEEYQEQKKRLEQIIKPEEIETHYPLAREKKRHIHAYLGPTNSGKTHNAIHRLKHCEKGIYLAPLRLLAREIYDDLIASGIKASLITGEEKIIDENATHMCSTVEMLSTEIEYDVAVIDEIQFLGDKSRGNAWSKALIGVAAQEVLVVGSTDAKFLIENIGDKCNDIVEFHEFQRLSPLDIIHHPMKIDDLESGDAIIAFSRKRVHQIAKILEQKYDKKVSMIYGALPPEVRLEEARRFNEGETDILISTDAIGYGLNLNINRILFSTMEKFDGEDMRVIDQTTFNQIAGRAGRFGKCENGFVGYINSFDNKDYRAEFKKLSAKLYKQLPSLEKAFYFPEWIAIESLSNEIKEYDSLNNLFVKYLQSFEDRNPIFDFHFDFLERTISHLDSLDNIDLENKFKVAFAPVRENNLYFFEKCVEHIIKGEVYYSKLQVHFDRAKNLEDLEEVTHNALLYMWMSQRYEDLFPDYEIVRNMYSEISYLIMELLKEGY